MLPKVVLIEEAERRAKCDNERLDAANLVVGVIGGTL
jgi:hypothetical protein